MKEIVKIYRPQLVNFEKQRTIYYRNSTFSTLRYSKLSYSNETFAFHLQYWIVLSRNNFYFQLLKTLLSTRGLRIYLRKTSPCNTIVMAWNRKFFLKNNMFKCGIELLIKSNYHTTTRSDLQIRNQSSKCNASPYIRPLARIYFKISRFTFLKGQ